MTAIFPSASQILAEWATADPAAALEQWRAGIDRFEARSWKGPAELDEVAELMCGGLACYVAGIPFSESWAGDSPDVTVMRTIWNILSAIFERPGGATGTRPETRRIRLVLAATRQGRHQPEDLGGSGFMSRFFDSGNRELMTLALCGSPACHGNEPSGLAEWFAEGQPSTTSRWNALRERAHQAQQHVNPLALQHGIEAAQGALTGANLAKIDKNTGKLKIRKLGVAKAAIRPDKAVRQAIGGAALTERLKSYNESTGSLPPAASPAEFASYPSKADYLQDWARRLIVAAKVTPTSALIGSYADRAAASITAAILVPSTATSAMPGAELGIPTDGSSERTSQETFDHLYLSAKAASSGNPPIDDQIVAILNDARGEWVKEISDQEL
jgi:hypothetical protein